MPEMTLEQARAIIEQGEPTAEYLLEGYSDDKTDEEIWELCQKTEQLATAPDAERIKNKALEAIVLIDQIPGDVGPEKLEKLKSVMEKKIQGKLEEAGLEGIEMTRLELPLNEETNLNEGFAIVSFKSEQKATQFAACFNNFKMTKKSVWKTYNLSEIDKYSRVPETWEAPPKPVMNYDIKDFEGYLNDENDQFLIMAKGNVRVQLNQCGYGAGKSMAPTGPVTVWEKAELGSEDWASVVWSPKGTYVLVFDKYERGIGCFGGSDMNRPKHRFSVPCAFNASFSPDEQYIMIQSGVTDMNECFIESEVKPEVSIWSVQEGKCVKSYKFPPGSYCAEAWERFQWSPSGRYLATTKTDYLCIFDVWNNFATLDDPESPSGKFLHIPGLKSYTFSPTEDHICYWVPEAGERPLRVCVRELPTFKQIRVKNLFKVKELEMMWHPQGKYLAVKVSKTLKGKKGFLFNSFELFHMHEKEVPVDTVDLLDHTYPYDVDTGALKTEKLGTMAWEPKGDRFCVMYGPNDVVTKVQVKILKMNTDGVSKAAHLPVVERTTMFNHLFWSPTGRYLILAQLKRGQSSGGALEWLDVDGASFTEASKYNPKKTKELAKPVSVSTSTHQFVTDMEWDPTGRYVVSSASALYHKMENGYIIWNFLGREIFVQKIEGMQVIKWRPRPVSKLSAKQVKSIKANISQYAKAFLEKDHLRSTEVGQVEQQKIQLLLNDWLSIKDQYVDMAEEQAKYEREIYGELDGDDDWEEVQMSSLVSTKVEIKGRSTV